MALLTDKSVNDNLDSNDSHRPLSARMGNVLRKMIRETEERIIKTSTTIIKKFGNGLQKSDDGTLSVKLGPTMQFDGNGAIGTTNRMGSGSNLTTTIQDAWAIWNANGGLPVSVKTKSDTIGGGGAGPSGWYNMLIYFQNAPGNGSWDHIASVIAWSGANICYCGSVSQTVGSSGFNNLSIYWEKMVPASHMNDSLRTMSSTSASTNVGAGQSFNPNFTFAIPSGWKFVGVLGTWTNGAVLINYAVDTPAMGATGNVGISVWSINHTGGNIQYSVSCKILIQRIF